MQNYKWSSHVVFHTVHTYSEFQEENVSNRTLSCTFNKKDVYSIL